VNPELLQCCGLRVASSARAVASLLGKEMASATTGYSAKDEFWKLRNHL